MSYSATGHSDPLAALTDLSLYIHVPFCVRRCRYCDFYSVEGMSGPIADKYVTRVLESLSRQLNILLPEKIETIFIGGGTPSFLPSVSLRRLLDGIQKLTGDTREFSIEANPESFNEEFLDLLSAYGVSRISMGLQSFDEELLRWLGRPAGSAAINNALELLSEKWKGRLSFDLMAALPRNKKGLIRDIEAALIPDPGHISIYELTVEKGTPLAGDRDSLRQLPNDEDKQREWDEVLLLLEKRAYRRYEVSNFSHPGEECLHNLRYWRMRPSLGVGPGAASTLPDRNGPGALRREEPADLMAWMEVQTDRAIETPLSARELALEYFMMGLRISDGLSLSAFEEVFGADCRQLVPLSLKRWTDAGALKVEEHFVRPTVFGMDFIDAILRDFASELDTGSFEDVYRWPPS